MKAPRLSFASVGFLVGLAVLAACAPPAAPPAPTAAPAPAKPTSAPAKAPAEPVKPAPTAASAVKPAAPAAWQAEWEKTLALANQEGEVVVAGNPEERTRTLFTETFASKYPGIRVKFQGFRGAEFTPKVEAERQGGVYAWDVFQGLGGNTGIRGANEGWFDPLRPAVILPENYEDRYWLDGFNIGFFDKDGKFAYKLGLWEQTLDITVNRDLVSKEQLNKAEDLLKPEFKGKIISADPRNPGSGAGSLTTFFLGMGGKEGGEAPLRALLRQDLELTTDERTGIEAVIRGRKAIGIALSEYLPNFQAQGVGRNVEIMRVRVGSSATVAGSTSEVALFNRAPHPNAAKVLLNWHMTRDAQQTQLNRNKEANKLWGSRRLDVEQWCPCAVKQGDKYYDSARWDTEWSSVYVRDTSREVLGR